MAGRSYRFSHGAEVEIVEMYRDHTIKVADILSAFNVSPATLTRIIRRHDVPLRMPSHSHPKKEKPPEAPTVNHTVNPLKFEQAKRPSMAVKVDAQGIVVEAHREDANLPLWVVTCEYVTTGIREVRAVSIEEAIHRAKTDPKIMRVIGVIEKGES